MITTSKVKQGTQQKSNSQTERLEKQNECMSAAIKTLTEQAEFYKGAGMTEVSRWLEQR